MSPRATRFPFDPKSTAHLRPGMFWPIVLADGAFGAGVVLGVPRADDPHLPQSSRIFVAGLVDWFGIAAPAVDDLVGARLITWGTAHVKSISATSDGVGLTGAASTDWNGVAMVSHRGGGQVAVYVNGAMRGPATASEAMDMPVLGTWGLTFVRALAERRLVARKSS